MKTKGFTTYHAPEKVPVRYLLLWDTIQFLHEHRKDSKTAAYLIRELDKAFRNAR